MAAAVTYAVHTTAAEGFTLDGAAMYEKGRPDWQLSHAAEILKLCGVHTMKAADGLFPAKPVVELACGTGKFTRPLLAALRALCPEGCRPHMILVEPSEGFSSALKDLAEEAGLPLHTASAEVMPFLPTGSVSACVAAQAFHWFADNKSATEICRVLAPDAKFVACWNARDRDNALKAEGDHSWVQQYEDTIDSAYDGATPRHYDRKWEAFARSFAGFKQPLQMHIWHREGGGHIATADQMVAAAMSISVIARRSKEERDAYEVALRAAVAKAPRIGASDLVLMPMFTEVLLAEKAV